MKKANISDAKNRLSAYLEMVKKGERVLIVDRDRVVAWLVPPLSTDDDEYFGNLERQGLVRRPEVSLSAEFLSDEMLSFPENADITEALLKDREESR